MHVPKGSPTTVDVQVGELYKSTDTTNKKKDVSNTTKEESEDQDQSRSHTLEVSCQTTWTSIVDLDASTENRVGDCPWTRTPSIDRGQESPTEREEDKENTRDRGAEAVNKLDTQSTGQKPSQNENPREKIDSELVVDHPRVLRPRVKR